MALDASAKAAYVAAKKAAMIACGAANNAALDALVQAEADAMIILIKAGEVDTTAGTLLSAAPSSPVTGTAHIK